MVFRKSPFSLDISKSTKCIAVKFYRTSGYYLLVKFESYLLCSFRGDFLKTIIGHLGMNRGSICFESSSKLITIISKGQGFAKIVTILSLHGGRGGGAKKVLHLFFQCELDIITI